MDAAGWDSRDNSQPGSHDRADPPAGLAWPPPCPACSPPPLPAGAGNAAAVAASAPHRLALFGLPPAIAEPVAMLAEILGWQVMLFPPGPAVCPPARLCLAMLPAGGDERPPIVAWSPELILNEHISRAGLSILDQPICISRVEQMLEALV